MLCVWPTGGSLPPLCLHPTIRMLTHGVLSCRPWALKLLANSLAPSIYGHDTIKEGMVLMLMGGMERVVGNMHIRCVVVRHGRAFMLCRGLAVVVGLLPDRWSYDCTYLCPATLLPGLRSQLAHAPAFAVAAWQPMLCAAGVGGCDSSVAPPVGQQSAALAYAFAC